VFGCNDVDKSFHSQLNWLRPQAVSTDNSIKIDVFSLLRSFRFHTKQAKLFLWPMPILHPKQAFVLPRMLIVCYRKVIGSGRSCEYSSGVRESCSLLRRCHKTRSPWQWKAHLPSRCIRASHRLQYDSVVGISSFLSTGTISRALVCLLACILYQLNCERVQNISVSTDYRESLGGVKMFECVIDRNWLYLRN